MAEFAPVRLAYLAPCEPAFSAIAFCPEAPRTIAAKINKSATILNFISPLPIINYSFLEYAGKRSVTSPMETEKNAMLVDHPCNPNPAFGSTHQIRNGFLTRNPLIILNQSQNYNRGVNRNQTELSAIWPLICNDHFFIKTIR
jgi:hypothetical protein